MTLSIYKPVQKFEEMAVDFPGSSSVTSRSMILRGDWLPAVWYCMEIDSVQYDTAGDSNAGDSKIFENLRETLIKIKSMLTHWSVAQAGWNDEKRMWLNNLVGLSL